MALCLQFRLLPLKRRYQHISDFARGLVEIERHALVSEAFADDVEVDAVDTLA